LEEDADEQLNSGPCDTPQDAETWTGGKRQDDDNVVMMHWY
jgi:hypothetical protein